MPDDAMTPHRAAVHEVFAPALEMLRRHLLWCVCMALMLDWIVRAMTWLRHVREERR